LIHFSKRETLSERKLGVSERRKKSKEGE